MKLFERTFDMGQATLWVLEGEPNDVVIVDKDGNKRNPNLDKVRKNAKLRGTRVAGRYGKGVGQLFYGGKLGNKEELTAQGNEFTNNEEILKAIGYKKTIVEID